MFLPAKAKPILVVLVLLTAHANAAVLLVPDEHATIQEAVDAASDGDEILVSAGTWTGTGLQVVDMQGKEITLRSTDGPEDTIIDGEGVRRGVLCNTVEDSNTIIEGFTITGGSGQWEDLDADGIEGADELVGGGLLAWYSSPLVRDCIFTANAAVQGGGVFATDSTITMTNCTFQENDASMGGGLCLYVFCTPTLSGNVFQNNTATSGAGVFASFGSVVSMTNCQFHANTASGNGGGCFGLYSEFQLTGCDLIEGLANIAGGGLFGYETDVTFERCYLRRNGSNQGGGAIRLESGDGTFNDCSFSLNFSLSNGGCIMWSGSSLSISHCSFSRNDASFGGAISMNGWSSVKDFVDIQSSHFYLNEAADAGAIIIEGEIDVEISNCTLNDNLAVFDGGAILNESADLLLTDSIFCGNAPEDILGVWDDNGGNEFPVECPEFLFGACCFEDTCSVVMEDVCRGDWQGQGISCENACVDCPGDLDGSGNVGIEDLLEVISLWGSCVGCSADFDLDGIVGVNDLLVIIAAWGPCNGG